MYESRNEILIQSDALKRCAQAVTEKADAIRSFFRRGGDIVFIACGSSYWASLSAHKTLGLALNRRTYAVKAGDVLMNPDEYGNIYETPLLLVPSRSGATTEQLEAIRILRKAYGGAPVLSIIIYDGSPLEALSDAVIRIPWANEISVCQTRSFSCLYLSMALIAGLYDDALREGMTAYLNASGRLARRDFARVETLAMKTAERDHLIAIGGGRQYGVMIEGAYICVEMAQMLAAYYAVTELRHGPIVTVTNKTTLAICSIEKAVHFEEQMAREAKGQGAHVIAVIGDGGFDGADTVFSMEGSYPPEAVALHYVYIMQVYAYHMALSKSLDPDHPGDLVRFIQIKTSPFNIRNIHHPTVPNAPGMNKRDGWDGFFVHARGEEAHQGGGGRPAFSCPCLAFPWISGTGFASFFGKCVMLLLSVPWGALGSGLLMPFLAICFTSGIVSHLRKDI